MDTSELKGITLGMLSMSTQSKTSSRQIQSGVLDCARYNFLLFPFHFSTNKRENSNAVLL